jgi:hypothetical protein
MDFLLQAKIDNIISEIENQLEKDFVDDSIARTLMAVSINRINLLMTHIGFLESKLESTIESNRMMAIHAENLIAENQRLSQIARY